MSNSTGIEWTDATWNPIRGCSRVSEGCRNCYAERVAHRFSGPGQPYEGLTQIVNGHPAWTGKVDLVEKHLLDPLKWKPVAESKVLGNPSMRTLKKQGAIVLKTERPRRIFVNSMSDLFHPNVPDDWIDRIFAVMALCPQHTFQVLTKRSERAWDYWFLNHRSGRLFWIAQAIDAMFPERTAATIAAKERLFGDDSLPNVIHGFSAEDQKTFDARWDIMGRFAACGFATLASLEPLLGAIDMGKGRLPDWVICGGESGPGARPMHPDWARGLRDQCAAAGVPFFCKQWGEWIPLTDYDPFVFGKNTDKYKHKFAWRAGCENDQELPISCYRLGKKAAGALLDGREWKEFPR